MNTDDYNQISIEEKFLDNPQLMKEGEVVTVITNSETSLPLSVEMPPSVILEVVSTEPGVKGNTATNATKPATLELIKKWVVWARREGPPLPRCWRQPSLLSVS
jgi:elongation factor P